MRSRTTGLLLTTLVLGTAACSTPRPGGLVANPDVLGKGLHIDRVQVDADALQNAQFSAIELADIDTSRVTDQKGVTCEDGAASLRSGLLQSASDRAVVATLVGSGAAGQLEVAIVEMSTGDAVARVLAGELGAGHAWVQVDARLVDPSSERTVAEFSDRRRGSGAIGFRDTFGSSGPAMVREMLEAIGTSLRLEIREIAHAP